MCVSLCVCACSVIVSGYRHICENEGMCAIISVGYKGPKCHVNTFAAALALCLQSPVHI